MPEITEEKKEERPTPKDNLVESKHSVKIGGKEIKYTVTTGTMILKEEVTDKDAEVEKPRAQIFFIAYTRDGVKDKAKRPVAFSFNGGPGSCGILFQRRTRLLVCLAAHGCARSASRCPHRRRRTSSSTVQVDR